MPYAHLFSSFISYLEAIIVNGGYTVLFLTTTLEGIPLIGMVIPGHVAIIAAGFLAKIGVLNLGWVILLALIGALLGDYIGFMIGRRYGMSFIDRLRPYFFITDAHIAKVQRLIGSHTGKTMILGRFSPITRALMPFMIGASGTSDRKFWLFNVIGAVSWSVVSIMVGYLFGAGYHAAAGTFGKLVMSAILLTLVIIWGYRFINMRFHIFRRYELFALILCILSVWTLAKTIQDAWAPLSFMANFDVWISVAAANLVSAHPFLADAALWVTNAGSFIVTMIIGTCIGIALLVRHKWRSAAVMLIAVWSTSFFLGTMKEFFLRARPDNALQTIVNDPSFPSGHAAMAAAFFVVLAYLLAPRIHGWVKRELLVVVCTLAAIAVGLSRIVLNVHWASDVIAGWALGIFCATASILLVRYLGAPVQKRMEGR